MKNIQVGVRIARRVQSTEHALDAALVEAGSLMTSMIEGRKDASLAAEVGQPALEAIVDVIGQLSKARAAVVRGHTELAAVAEQQNIGWRMDGPYESKTKPTGVLTVVAA